MKNNSIFVMCAAKILYRFFVVLNAIAKMTAFYMEDNILTLFLCFRKSESVYTANPTYGS